VASGRRKVNKAEAAELVSAWRTSRQALPTWCAARGLDGRSLRQWARRLLEAPTILQVVEVTPPPTRAGEPVRVLVDEIIIEVPDGFADDTLLRVLRVVRGC
jgi:hypothetical protein